ncbi:MAG: CoB--CoM heterodisulfide reductase iron-sulfur subunit A family protein [Proteobacteria bacterium]|nr:CoB--CoM heterodisulfide reductase iron-sulfur subunit A family protein [Pseudomonadota bacterium]MBU4383184.1 CoB--CoM heterodisulfide reductase iron-sulfur subunit A family protein [Pseudomonadota bacterium]MBU4605212.1 CoB--CoM heterodisulfide reductase iron-sulfur subunit A family protein [Pseudomonadota bacterium]MCG2764224.1 CoB--CoM heterodisulfide reductase iron-sulfur subunit A family protein [Desulfarculaceae bacterium]
MSKLNNCQEQPKIGVYVCHCGGNISDHVDVAKVVEQAGGLDNVTVARDNSFMCSDPGQELIIEDIKSGKVNRIVVASCAPALHESTFRGAIARAGMNPYLYEHANIREQVSWVHHGPGATDKATALVAAAVGKAGELEALEPIRVEAEAHATVLGGGVAGMSAARDLAAQGLKVALVEKSPFLGGQVAQLDKTFPSNEAAGELLSALAAQVLADQRITVYTCAELSEYSGYVGSFKLKIRRTPPSGEDLERLALAKDAAPGEFVPFVGVAAWPVPYEAEEVALVSGAIVLATGFEHYTPPMGEYGYGQMPEVITLPELIRLMADESATGEQLVVNGKPVGSLALIHCVGSRQIPGVHQPGPDGKLNQHCSRVCCTATLQAACELREKFPETNVFELYRDIRTYGRGHEEYYLNAGRSGVIFARFEPEAPPVVTQGGEDSALTVTVLDKLLAGEELAIGVDLVVLAVGMEPRDNQSLVEKMKLPVGADRFLLEVHPKLRPVELPAAGIYLAGACQAPMDTSEAANAAGAAAAKAGAILSAGFVELDPFVAEVDESKCVGSGACVQACLADEAIEMIDTQVGKRARVNPALCMGCGVCVAACEQGAIELSGWTLGQYEAMVDAIVAQALPQGA